MSRPVENPSSPPSHQIHSDWLFFGDGRQRTHHGQDHRAQHVTCPLASLALPVTYSFSAAVLGPAALSRCRPDRSAGERRRLACGLRRAIDASHSSTQA